MQALFGDVLLTKDGEKPTTEVLNGKVVGIYFSAHWCPPCRGFTPALAKSYTDHLKAKGMEIVFVSSDRDEDAFNDYYGEQPWVSLPYANRDAKNALSKKFKVQGIPTFVVLDAEGKLITSDGREAVGNDPTGEDFPWVPKTIEQLLDFKVQTKNGTVPMSSLDGKVLGLYFSAHWCPPCRGYTPQLVKKYEEITAAGLPFEIVFVSSDRDEAAFNEYYGEQPWATLPYAERKRKEELSSHFGVEGIPSLVLLDKDRSVITKSGRGAVMGDLKDFPFHPKPVSDLAKTADGINDAPAVVLLCETAPKEEQAALLAALEPVAAEYVAKAKAAKEEPDYAFFLASASAGVVPRIRQLTGMPALPPAPHEHPLEKKEKNGGGWGCDGCGKSGASATERYRCTKGCDFDYCEECYEKASNGQTASESPTLLLLDVPDNGGYYKPAAGAYPITAEGVKALLRDYEAKKLTRRQFGEGDEE